MLIRFRSPHETDMILGVYTNKISAQKAKIHYINTNCLDEDDIIMKTFYIDNLSSHMIYILCSYKEFIGQVVRNPEYISDKWDAILEKAKEINSKNEWIYYYIPINEAVEAGETYTGILIDLV
jgi:hypothetical protein